MLLFQLFFFLKILLRQKLNVDKIYQDVVYLFIYLFHHDCILHTNINYQLSLSCLTKKGMVGVSGATMRRQK